jgi:hypothetical protein
MALFAAQLQPWEEVSLYIQYLQDSTGWFHPSLSQPWNHTLISQLHNLRPNIFFLFPLHFIIHLLSLPPSSSASSSEEKTRGQC